MFFYYKKIKAGEIIGQMQISQSSGKFYSSDDANLKKAGKNSILSLLQAAIFG
jgi:hypothetical protein